MRIEGKIITWKDEQGYGFIAPDNGGPQVFVHIKAFLDGNIRPIANDPVSFELTRDEQGRLQAKYVRRVGRAFRFRRFTMYDAMLFLGVALFVGALAYLVFSGYLREFVPALYLGVSIVTFLAYWKDKRAARLGRWRTQESILQALSLAGGWPGALLAQRLLRHKSSKASFLTVFWVTVLANVAVLGWSLSPQGSRVLYDLLHALNPR